jgi:transcriptional regulator with XRE-family HTH domain
MPQNTSTFTDWLLAEMEQRGWSQSDLARHAKVSNAAISDIFSGRRNIGKNLATALADGLDLPIQTVFRAAGLLPPDKKVNEEIEQIVHEAERMNRDEQLELLSYIRWRNNQRKKK